MYLLYAPIHLSTNFDEGQEKISFSDAGCVVENNPDCLTAFFIEYDLNPEKCVFQLKSGLRER